MRLSTRQTEGWLISGLILYWTSLIIYVVGNHYQLLWYANSNIVLHLMLMTSLLIIFFGETHRNFTITGFNLLTNFIVTLQFHAMLLAIPLNRIIMLYVIYSMVYLCMTLTTLQSKNKVY